MERTQKRITKLVKYAVVTTAVYCAALALSYASITYLSRILGENPLTSAHAFPFVLGMFIGCAIAPALLFSIEGEEFGKQAFILITLLFFAVPDTVTVCALMFLDAFNNVSEPVIARVEMLIAYIAGSMASLFASIAVAFTIYILVALVARVAGARKHIYM